MQTLTVGWNVHHFQEGQDFAQIRAALGTAKTLRFLNWLKTNRTSEKSPKFRAVSEMVTADADWLFHGGAWDTWHGVPLSVCVQTANDAGARGWYNAPDTLSDEELAKYARVVCMTSAQRPYIAHTNEIWNQALFHSHETYNTMGRRFDKVLAWHAWRTNILVKATKNDALVVVEAHARNVWIAEQLMRQVDGAQALAIAPYMTGRDFFELLQWFKWLPQAVAHKQLAVQYRVPLLAYECGQHVEGATAARMNTSPVMETVYRFYLETLRQIGFTVVLPYSLASHYGQKCFGHYQITTDGAWVQTPKLSVVKEYQSYV
jgi:hypothetical protein